MSADHPGVHRLGQRSAGHAPVRTRQEKAEKPAARGPRRCNRGDTRDHGAHGRVNGGGDFAGAGERNVEAHVIRDRACPPGLARVGTRPWLAMAATVPGPCRDGDGRLLVRPRPAALEHLRGDLGGPARRAGGRPGV